MSGSFPRPSKKGGEEADRPRIGPGSVTILVLLAIVGLIYAASSVWTEILWFKQMNSTRVLLTQWFAFAGLFLVGFLVMASAILLTLNFVYRHRAASTRGEASANLRQYQEALEPLRRVVFWGLALLLGVTSGAKLAGEWQTVLQFVNRTPFGTTDPQFGLDVSFFVFTLPALDLLVSFLMKTTLFALAAAIIVSYLYGTIRLFPRPHASRPARHITGILAAVASLLFGANYWLGRYGLLTKRGSNVDGAMYADIKATLPAHSILAVISVLVAVLFLIAAFKGTWRLPVIGVSVTVVSALVVGGMYPALIQQFRVTPNERELESPYIQHNIDATLKAYGLEGLEYTNYDAATTAQPGQLREDSESTSQIRLLDPQVITKTVQQLQQSRPYYGFDSGMKVDRYTVGDERRDTVIAVREMNLAGLSAEQRTWVNMHTVYTHGFGVVAAYGNTLTSDGLPSYWEQSVPSRGEMGDYEERVYFSPNAPQYSIVGAPEGADPQELDYPDDNAKGGQVATTFTGDGGPSVGNLWNKLLYSIKFASTDIFFSSQTNSASQILYVRDPLARVAKVAPFLTLEQEAYPAVVDVDGDPSTPKRLVWVVDGYTTTDDYPYSQHESLAQTTIDSQSDTMSQYVRAETINYMRNSVKAIVDAYDGSVRLFQWDQEDPILQTWMKIYPDRVEPLSQISGDLMSHMRYPEDMFKVQRELLTSYHVKNASDFYAGGDRWRLAEETSTAVSSSSEGAVAPSATQPPYYLTMQMPGQESAEFSLTSVFVPGGESKREAMAGFLAVDSETGNEPGKIREGYGKLRLLALPSSTTVPGPGQVQNAYDSNETIARQLNLLNQADSKVIRGNLLTLPVGGGLLYVQPVYVQGTGSASYPVLRSVLTAFGNQVGFAPTLAESLDQTFGGDSAATVAGADQDSGGEQGAEGEAPVTLSAQQKLAQALSAASKAMQDSQTALSGGDWAAYGKAQETLNAAIAAAIEAQSQIDGAAGAGGATGADGADAPQSQ
ncbi:MAG: UPF0182 family protein [Schaalia hyovaginalis]|uniref:UPF0182 family membrane protein n=1 Tax=Schaalia hyovaginalis TaxID=29316 RepID=UPI0023F647F9|nr:UPF0182 family protein [Schaalia hyovaginalis]MCI7672194.1 UPF0182 family protein [Schaalia hyovaginalis]MDY5506837.1 UPF0182 family protein [Schaalia hyovaginalis]